MKLKNINLRLLGNSSIKKMLITALAACTMTITAKADYVSKVVSADGSTVTGYETLAAAVAAANDGDRVVMIRDILDVTSTISIEKNITFDGNGNTLSVPVPYVNASGYVADSPTLLMSVLRVNLGVTARIENLSVMGGQWGAAIDNRGTLLMERVDIFRSNRGLNNSGKAHLKRCCIVRNCCEYGAGILNDSGSLLVLESSALSENRSLAMNGGGGAMECRAGSRTWIVNSVLANNASTEIGGAINLYNGQVCLINSTLVGNFTTASAARYGGAIGVNNGKLLAVGSVICNNYHVNNTTVTPSDIGVFSSVNNAKIQLKNCVYGDIVNSTSLVPEITGCEGGVSDDEFLAYSDEARIYCANLTTATTLHSPKCLAAGNPYLLYAPVLNASHAISTGVYETYFDASDLDNIQACYRRTEGGEVIAMDNGSLITGGTDTSHPITRTFEDTARDHFLAGASAARPAGAVWTVKLAEKPVNGDTDGISLYERNVLAGESVVIEAIPALNYRFVDWKRADDTVFSTDRVCKFMPTSDLALKVAFESGTQPIPVPTAKTGLVYNGSAQFGFDGVRPAEIERVSGENLAEIAVGSHTVTFRPAAGHCWQDSSTGEKTLTFEIGRAPLAVEGLRGVDRLYDGTTTVALTNGTLVGVCAGDKVSAVIPSTGTVNTAEVGEGKVVAFDPITLSGSDLGNYTFAGQPTVTVSIFVPTERLPGAWRPHYIEAPNAEVAAARAIAQVPDAAAFAAKGINTVEYQALFKSVATEKSAGVYSVAVVLKDDVAAEVSQYLTDKNASDVAPAMQTARSMGRLTKITLEGGVPGLYYSAQGVKNVSDNNWNAPGHEWGRFLCGNDGKVEVIVPYMGKDSGYYRLKAFYTKEDTEPTH